MVDIRLEGVTKRYGRTRAVQDLTLEVPSGCVFGLLGPNGAGKTTTVEMIAGATTPTAGTVQVLGDDGFPRSKETTSSIGVVFGENLAPEPSLSAQGYLKYIGRLYGMAPAQIREEALHLADWLGFDGWHQRIGDLSSGNKRKVELIRALVPSPGILVLDEPTRELDIPSKQAVWELLTRYAAADRTILLSSHDPLEIGRLCDAAVVLRGGSIVWRGPISGAAAGRGTDVEGLVDLMTGGDVTFQNVHRASP